MFITYNYTQSLSSIHAPPTGEAALGGEVVLVPQLLWLHCLPISLNLAVVNLEMSLSFEHLKIMVEALHSHNL